MGRIIAIDYGKRRTGIATTDPLQIIASPLTTVETPKLVEYLNNYFQTETVDCMVVGEPLQADGLPTPLEKDIQKFIQTIKKQFPNLKIARHDERYTSVRAREVIQMSVSKKKKRRDKSLIDKVSAAIILQEYMGFI